MPLPTAPTQPIAPSIITPQTAQHGTSGNVIPPPVNLPQAPTCANHDQPSHDAVSPTPPTPQLSPKMRVPQSALATPTRPTQSPCGQSTATPRIRPQHDIPAANPTVSSGAQPESSTHQPRRSVRTVHAPKWLNDYIP
ncbi:hypothetical protein V1264_022184 [Littorina saxatilis]|uniref:Uncharacterized protein n=1 Tax=Littorina saxatilis TaxID=31220 RepID=A0AAN9FWZ4_9CAEN